MLQEKPIALHFSIRYTEARPCRILLVNVDRVLRIFMFRHANLLSTRLYMLCQRSATALCLAISEAASALELGSVHREWRALLWLLGISNIKL